MTRLAVVVLTVAAAAPAAAQVSPPTAPTAPRDGAAPTAAGRGAAPPAGASTRTAATGVPSPTEAAQAAAPVLDDVPPIRPDPRAVAEAREANFEPESVREGLAIGGALGPSMQVGFGIPQSSGTGGGYDLRIGTVASPRWVWLVEAAGTVYREVGDDGVAHNNNSALFTVGGQFYARDAIWLRGGAGLATFTRRSETSARAESRFYGGGAIGAGGLDLLRRRSFALSTELLIAVARYRDGTVVGGTLQLGVSWY